MKTNELVRQSPFPVPTSSMLEVLNFQKLRDPETSPDLFLQKVVITTLFPVKTRPRALAGMEVYILFRMFTYLYYQYLAKKFSFDIWDDGSIMSSQRLFMEINLPEPTMFFKHLRKRGCASVKHGDNIHFPTIHVKIPQIISMDENTTMDDFEKMIRDLERVQSVEIMQALWYDHSLEVTSAKMQQQAAQVYMNRPNQSIPPQPPQPIPIQYNPLFQPGGPFAGRTIQYPNQDTEE